MSESDSEEEGEGACGMFVIPKLASPESGRGTDGPTVEATVIKGETNGVPEETATESETECDEFVCMREIAILGFPDKARV
jgi:hypothetical protein